MCPVRGKRLKVFGRTVRVPPDGRRATADGAALAPQRAPRLEAGVSATTPDAAHPLNPDDPADADVSEYFRALVQTLADATLVLDTEFHVRDQTPSTTLLLGRDSSALRGQHLLSIVHADDRPSAAAFLSAAVQRPGTTAPTEWRVQHADGHWLHLEVVCNNLLDDTRLQCLVLTGRDISSRKELEQQLSHQAFHDSLTDLANRALMLDRVEHAFKGRRSNFALLFLRSRQLQDRKRQPRTRRRR